jgi:O-antigen/teichoic acid export membrane protein
MSSDQPMSSVISTGKLGEPKVSNFEQNIKIVAKGGGVTFAGKLFLNVLRFVTALLLARILGADQLGLYSLSLSALNITMGLALFGLDAAIIRYIAIMVGREDDHGTWGAIQIGIGISLILSAILGTALYAFSFTIAENVFHEPGLAPLLQLASVFVPILVVNDQLYNAIRGFKKFGESVIAQYVYQPVTRLIMIGILAVIGLNARYAVIAYALSTVTASIAMFIFLNKSFPLKRTIKVAPSLLKEMMSFAFPVWLSGLMVKFQGNIQTLFIGTLNTIAGVGIFSIVSQITMVSGEFSSSINTTSKPVIAELNDHQDIGQMEHIYQLTNKWIVMVQIPIFLFMLIFPKSILSLFGESYMGGATALIILAVANFVKVCTGMGGIIIDMAGYTKMKLFNSFIRLTLYIVLDYLLIPRWGLIGAATAVLVGEGTVNLLRLIQVYIIYRILPFNLSFIKPLVATGAALASVLLIGIWLPVQANLINTAIDTIVMCLVYVVILLALGLSAEEINLFKSAFAKVRYMINRRGSR